MGGIGSGWFGKRSTRATTEDYLAVDVRRLLRESLLTPGRCLDLTWTTDRGATVASVRGHVKADRVILGSSDVRLDWTRCGLGGRRAWFLCPRCFRRCCLLYHARGFTCLMWFACRVCHGLAYRVENLGREERAVHRAWKIIGNTKTDFKRKGWKPRWQRWHTHQRQELAVEQAGEVLALYDERISSRYRELDARLLAPRRRRGRR